MISFLVPFKSEDPHRQASVKYVLDRLSEDWPKQEILFGYNMDGKFNRSAARNQLADAATGETFVFVDADSYCPALQVLAACAQIEAGNADWSFPYGRYCSLTELSTKRVIEGEPMVEERLDFDYVFPSVEHPEPSVGGCVVVSRGAFAMVGGYDERFVGWGEEDRAFALSLGTLLHPEVRLGGPIYHLWHPWVEADCFGQPHFESNRALCNRYREAAHNSTAMMNLVGEHR